MQSLEVALASHEARCRYRHHRTRLSSSMCQARVMREDLPVQTAKRQTRLEALAVDKRLTGTSELFERLGLPPRAVQREHELRGEPFSLGMRCRGVPEPGDDLG